jgi:hypothetical protein
MGTERVGTDSGLGVRVSQDVEKDFIAPFIFTGFKGK